MMHDKYWLFGMHNAKEFVLEYSQPEGKLLVNRKSGVAFSRCRGLLDLGQSSLLARVYREIDEQYWSWVDGVYLNSPDYERVLALKAGLTVMSVDEFYQQPCSPATTIRRIQILREYGLVRPDEVLLLGDDDLISPELARMGVRCHVLEAAENVLAVLDKISNAVTEKYDISSGLLLSKTYPWVIMDPPYLGSACCHFFRLAITSLSVGGLLALSYSDYGQFGLLGRLLEDGLLEVVARFPLLNVYLDPSSGAAESNLSDFFILRRGPCDGISAAYWEVLLHSFAEEAAFPDLSVRHGKEEWTLFLDDGQRGIHKFIPKEGVHA